jgi:hypothetical protein
MKMTFSPEKNIREEEALEEISRAIMHEIKVCNIQRLGR